MAQTIIQKNMEDIYLSLFSFSGSEVYALEATSFNDVMKNHACAIPLLKHDKHLFVLSDNNHVKLTKGTHKSLSPITPKPLKEKVKRDVYIIGNNNKLAFIEESFKAYETLHKSSFNASLHESDCLEQLVKTLNESETNATLLLLSDDYAEVDALDANVMHALLYIKLHLKRENVDIIVELLDPKNDALVKDFDIENTIISNKIISLLLSKLAIFPETEAFYDQLLTIDPDDQGKDDQAIVLQKAEDFLSLEFPYHTDSLKGFVEALYEGSKHAFVLIGLVRNDTVEIFTGDFTKQALTIKRDDDLILMKT